MVNSVLKKVGILCIIVVACLLICKPFRSPQRGDLSSLYKYLQDLQTSGYTIATESQDPILEDSLAYMEPAVEETIHAEGTWSPDSILTPEDTVSVEVSTIEIAESQWVKVVIDGKLADLRKISWFEKEDSLGRWSSGLELVVIPDYDIGIMAAYRVGTLWGINGEVALVVDLNEHITSPPDWIAPELRLSKTLWGSWDLGAGAGIHISIDDTPDGNIKPHAGAGLTYRF